MNINTSHEYRGGRNRSGHAVNRTFLLQGPADIIQQSTCSPDLHKTTNYAHFGKDDPDITGKKTDKAAALSARRASFKLKV